MPSVETVEATSDESLVWSKSETSRASCQPPELTGDLECITEERDTGWQRSPEPRCPKYIDGVGSGKVGEGEALV